MSVTDVHATYGAVALWRLVGALLAWLLLHAVRGPLHLVLRCVEALMSRVDAYATRQTTCTRPRRPKPFPRAAAAA